MSDLEEKISKLPADPGVYVFRDSAGSIIYIGKAGNLKRRVSSYLRPDAIKTRVLVQKISDIDYIVVDNEVEALLLENRLIKKHSPRYNIMLKDSKTYAYIKITQEKFPRILTTRKASGRGKFFGPYVNGRSRAEVTALATRLFKLRTCKTLPKRACLSHYIGICKAPCIGLVSKEQYDSDVRDAIKFIEGETLFMTDRLKSEMKDASGRMDYETALEKRRQIESIQGFVQRQNVDRIRNFDQDVIAFSAVKDRVTIGMFSVKRGVILGKKEFSFSIDFETPQRMVEGFVKLYYSQNYIPNEILIASSVWETDQERRLTEEYLSRLRKSRVRIVIPEKGSKRDLVVLAMKNLREGASEALVALQKMLNLPSVPQTMEIFDASNLGSDYLVGAMTRWVEGRPDKSGYRKFKIRSLAGKSDDYAAIREIVHRRYKRLIAEKKEMPGLIMIDGGPGQLSSAIDALKGLGLHMPIIALAKKEEEIYLPGRTVPVRLDKNSQVMLLLRAMRDSVHRMAISYNRKQREMEFEKSAAGE